MSDRLASVLNEAVVERLASRRSLARGRGYLEDGRVGPLRTSTKRVSATVQGTARYTVELRAERGVCSSPVPARSGLTASSASTAWRWR